MDLGMDQKKLRYEIKHTPRRAMIAKSKKADRDTQFVWNQIADSLK